MQLAEIARIWQNQFKTLFKQLYLDLYTPRLFWGGNHIKSAIFSACGLKYSLSHPPTPHIHQKAKNYLWSS